MTDEPTKPENDEVVETAKKGVRLDVDPGKPPRAGKDEHDDTSTGPAPAEPAVAAEPMPVPDLQALEDGADAAWMTVATILNGATVRSQGGPEDIWIPTPEERRLFKTAMARYAARHHRLAAALENADPLVIAATIGEYALRERGRSRAWREAHADEAGDVVTIETPQRPAHRSEFDQ